MENAKKNKLDTQFKVLRKAGNPKTLVLFTTIQVTSDTLFINTFNLLPLVQPLT